MPTSSFLSPPWHPMALQSHLPHPLPQPGCKFPPTEKAGIMPIIALGQSTKACMKPPKFQNSGLNSSDCSNKLRNPSGSALPHTKHLWLKGKLCKACFASQRNPSLAGNTSSTVFPLNDLDTRCSAKWIFKWIYRDAVSSFHLGRLYRPKILTSVCKHQAKQGARSQKSSQAVSKFIYAMQKYWP